MALPWTASALGGAPREASKGARGASVREQTLATLLAMSAGRAAVLAVVWWVAGLVGCQPEELNGGPNVVCEEIGRTISNVSWACGTSLEAANARGRAFLDEYRCMGPTAPNGEYLIEVGLECPLSIAQMPCEAAIAAGEDHAKWVAAAPACAEIAVPVGAGGVE